MYFDFICDLLEGVSINKDYLLSLVDKDIVKLNNIKEISQKYIKSIGIELSQKDNDKLVSLISMLKIKGLFSKDVEKYFHDVIVDKTFNILYNITSDTKAKNLEDMIEAYEEKKNNNLSKEENDEYLRVITFHDFEDGFKWVIAVDEEGKPVGCLPSKITNKTMGHCGNEPSKQDGDTYYELRDDKNKSYITVILDKEGHIRESKGKHNLPPKEDVKKYMKWLLLHPIVKGVSYEQGYAPNSNFGIAHMVDDDEFLEKIKKEKPKVISHSDKLVIFYKKRFKEEGKEKVKKEILTGIIDEGLELSFSEIVGIFGENPFDKDEMYKLIKTETITPYDVFNAGYQHLTKEIQQTFIDVSKSNSGNIVALFKSSPNHIKKHMNIEAIEKYNPIILISFYESFDKEKAIEFAKNVDLTKIVLPIPSYYADSIVLLAKYNKDSSKVINKIFESNPFKYYVIQFKNLKISNEDIGLVLEKLNIKNQLDILHYLIFHDESYTKKAIEDMRFDSKNNSVKDIAMELLEFIEDLDIPSKRLAKLLKGYLGDSYDACISLVKKLSKEEEYSKRVKDLVIEIFESKQVSLANYLLEQR